MARYTGEQNKLVLQYESGTYATTSGAGHWIGEVQNHDITENTGVISVRYLGTANRNVSQFVDGVYDVNGRISYYPQDFRMLLFALGSCTDGGSPSPYTHALIETQNTDTNSFTSGVFNPFVSFTLEDSHTAAGTGQNFVRTVKGCNVNNLTLTATQGEPLTMEVNYVGQSTTYSSGPSTSVTADTNRCYLWRDLRLHLPSGTVIDGVRELSWSITNNLSTPRYLDGTRNISVPNPLNRDYSISVTADAMSEWTKSFYDQYFLGGSTFNMLLDISASTGSRDCFITMSGCKLTGMSDPSKLSEVNTQTLTIIPQTCNVSINDLIFKFNAW